MSSYDAPTPTRWTIHELGEQVAAALSVDYAGPRSGQVRAVPDARTIRYYATLGLVDRPVETRGRTALYDRHHLMQVVAIKRLQEQGKSLAEIQVELSGAGRSLLAELAQLPDSTAPTPPRRRTRTARPAFWAAEPSPVSDPAPPAAPPAEPLGGDPPVALVELELAPGIRLQVEASRLPTGQQTEILHRAAAPLVDTVRRLGLGPHR